MIRISRRGFLASSAAAAATLMVNRSVFGANDDVRLAVVGVRGRGSNHIKECGAVPGVRIVALCDPDQRVLDQQAKNMKQDVTKYTDIRKLIEDKGVDGVVVATPNHWHVLATIWACQAGKDVYVEKPVSHNIWEGRKAVEAARKYNRIVQAGTQSRSDKGLGRAIEFIRSGEVGKLICARSFCYKRRETIGKVTQPTPIPEWIDYDLWCGPAPKGR